MPKLRVKNANVTEMTPNTTFPIVLVPMCSNSLVTYYIFITYNAWKMKILHGLLLFKKKINCSNYPFAANWIDKVNIIAWYVIT